VPAALEPAEDRCALGLALQEGARPPDAQDGREAGQRRGEGFGIGVGIGDPYPLDGEALAGSGLPQVGAFDAGDLQHLQAAAAFEIARRTGRVVRQEAVEPGARPVVLGQVDVARAGVDGSRLVGHEAHVLDGYGAGGPAIGRRHLEDEAVIAGAHLRAP
jgi:hypothetical protein